MKFMTSRLNKIILMFHVTSSIAWLGAVVVFLVLAINGLTSKTDLIARSSLISMELSAWFVIIPLCFLSFLTGIIQALTTKWGLFKHYWIIVKLILTLGSTLLLLLHIKPINFLSHLATEASFSNSQYAGQIIDLITKSGAAILVLLGLITISIYKPWGKFELIQNKNQFVKMENYENKSKKPWTFYALICLISLIIIFIISHLFGGGMKGH